MPRKRHKPEEIVAKLRQVDVLVSQGQSVADAVRSIGVTEVTYYRWRQEFGGLKSEGLSGILCAGPVDHHARMNLSSNMMANWVFASPHSRGDIFHSVAV